MGINKERTDARGRATGSYLMSTKGNVTQSDKESLWTFVFQGIKYFGGGSSPREPHRWSHVCLGVRYTAAGTAERTIFADGEHNFNFTSAFLPASSWPRSRSFTFGGREVETRYTMHDHYPPACQVRYSGVHLHGYMTDIQIFSRALTTDEMVGYTSCQQVM